MNRRVCSKCKAELPLDSEHFGVRTKTRSGFSTECRQCLKIRGKAHRQENKEKLHQQNTAYKKAHPEWLREAKRRHYQKHREKVIEKVRRYRREYPERCRASKEKAAVKNSERRARIQAAGGSFTAQDVQRLYEEQNGKCVWCSLELGNKFHVDHVIPLSRGGSNDASNIRISCKGCNLKRGPKLPEEWFALRIPKFLSHLKEFYMLYHGIEVKFEGFDGSDEGREN